MSGGASRALLATTATGLMLELTNFKKRRFDDFWMRGATGGFLPSLSYPIKKGELLGASKDYFLAEGTTICDSEDLPCDGVFRRLSFGKDKKYELFVGRVSLKRSKFSQKGQNFEMC